MAPSGAAPVRGRTPARVGSPGSPAGMSAALGRSLLGSSSGIPMGCRRVTPVLPERAARPEPQPLLIEELEPAHGIEPWTC